MARYSSAKRREQKARHFQRILESRGIKVVGGLGARNPRPNASRKEDSKIFVAKPAIPNSNRQRETTGKHNKKSIRIKGRIIRSKNESKLVAQKHNVSRGTAGMGSAIYFVRGLTDLSRLGSLVQFYYICLNTKFDGRTILRCREHSPSNHKQLIEAYLEYGNQYNDRSYGFLAFVHGMLYLNSGGRPVLYNGFLQAVKSDDSRWNLLSVYDNDVLHADVAQYFHNELWMITEALCDHYKRDALFILGNYAIVKPLRGVVESAPTMILDVATIFPPVLIVRLGFDLISAARDLMFQRISFTSMVQMRRANIPGHDGFSSFSFRLDLGDWLERFVAPETLFGPNDDYEAPTPHDGQTEALIGRSTLAENSRDVAVIVGQTIGGAVVGGITVAFGLAGAGIVGGLAAAASPFYAGHVAIANHLSKDGQINANNYREVFDRTEAEGISSWYNETYICKICRSVFTTQRGPPRIYAMRKHFETQTCIQARVRGNPQESEPEPRLERNRDESNRFVSGGNL